MAEPVTLEEARLYCRVDETDEDTFLTSRIAAARAWVENFTGLILVEREITETFDCFAIPLKLAAWPVAADAQFAISYLSADAETESFADYRAVFGSFGVTLLPEPGAEWPSTYRTLGAVSVTFGAGYSTPEDVPEDLKQAILMHVQIAFERRAMTPDEDASLEALCRPYRKPVIG